MTSLNGKKKIDITPTLTFLAVQCLKARKERKDIIWWFEKCQVTVGLIRVLNECFTLKFT